MKRLLLASLVGSFTIVAAAQETATNAAAEATIDDAQRQVEIEEVDRRRDSRTQAQKDADRNCIRYTGTRITSRQVRDKGCVVANGRVYSREDLDRTGEVDIAEALRKLDPAIR